MKKTEIERKFLVDIPKFLGFVSRTRGTASQIEQGYLSIAPPVVRIRVENYGPGQNRAFLTVKGPGLLSRTEVECQLSLEAANDLLFMCSGTRIGKTRYSVDGWEVDVFHGVLEGLVVAEIELKAEDQEFEAPHWLGAEVTHDARYTNLWLSMNGLPK